MADPTNTAETLRAALDILRSDALVAYHRVTRELDGLTLHLEVDGELFQLRCTSDQIHFEPPAVGTPDALVRTSRRIILDLVDGKAEMMDCLLTGSLLLQADVGLLTNLARASVAFSEGAIRSRDMRDLLARFRGE